MIQSKLLLCFMLVTSPDKASVAAVSGHALSCNAVYNSVQCVVLGLASSLSCPNKQFRLGHITFTNKAFACRWPTESIAG